MPTTLEPSPVSSRRRATGSRRAAPAEMLCLIGWVVLICLAWQSLGAGLRIRRQVWHDYAKWRFTGDIENAYSKGNLALDPRNGYLNLYTRFSQQPRPGSYFNLDYPPLRLLIMTDWVAWTHRQFPNARHWEGSYAFNAPLLQINADFAVAGFAGMWLLVSFWTWRSSTPARPPLTGTQRDGWASAVARFPTDRRLLTAAAVGLVAAELFWFNPALIWDAHIWPQWDIWPLPFYIFAMLAASLDAWWSAGLLLALGALLKGQMLMVAPVMILWPLFAGKPAAALRCAVGLAFGLLGYAAPWLLRTSDETVWQLSWFSLIWVASAALAAALVRLRFQHARNRLALRGAAALAAAALLAWPFIYQQGPANWYAFASIAALFSLVALLPPKRSPGWGLWLSLAVVAALAICPYFGGSMDWWTVGFERGTVQYMNMHNGNTLNLAAILERNGWHSPKEDAWLLHGQMLDLRSVLIYGYGLGLILCAAGAAMHDRRRDSRLLIALVTPWILLYVLLPQIHDRYLNFAAGLTAVAPAVGVGLTLVHLIITGLALASTVLSVNFANPPAIQHFLNSINPDAAWMTLMCAGIFLWVSIAPHPRRAERLADTAPSTS